MSWSINQSGSPVQVAAALTATAAAMDDGQSKTEFAAALPSMVGAVMAYPGLDCSIDAGGHGSIDPAGNFVYATVHMTVTHKLAAQG